MKPHLRVVTNRKPTRNYAEVIPTIKVRITIEKEFTDPKDAYDSAEVYGEIYPDARVQVIKRSRTDLPMLSILVLQHMQLFDTGQTFVRADFEPLMDRWHYSHESITPALCRLAREGHIVRVDRGEYMISE
jgi:hypothetical protein